MKVSLQLSLSSELSETLFHGVPGPPTLHCSSGLVTSCRVTAAPDEGGFLALQEGVTCSRPLLSTLLPSPSWSPVMLLTGSHSLLPTLQFKDFERKLTTYCFSLGVPNSSMDIVIRKVRSIKRSFLGPGDE